MGLVTSFIWTNTGTTDDPDPTTSLTSRERYLLKATWSKLTETQAKKVETGVLIFMTLFKKHPHYKTLFPFRNVPMEELPTNNRFKAHCITVVYSLTSMVYNLEVPELLRELLLKQGIAHVPRKIGENAYEDLKGVLMDIFNTILTKEEISAWDKFLSLGVEIFVEGARSVEN